MRHLVAVLDWPEEDEEAPIIHYCRPVLALDGSILWGKQGYVPWTDTGANPLLAQLDYCRDLIEILNEYVAVQQLETDAGDDRHDVIALQPSVDSADPGYNVQVSLSTGETVHFKCSPGDPRLQLLFQSLNENAEGSSTETRSLTSLDTLQGETIHFHPSQIVAIETIPNRA